MEAAGTAESESSSSWKSGMFSDGDSYSVRHVTRGIARVASGYIYYVSLKGITGSSALDVATVADKLPLIRAHTSIPIGVGFGIRDAASACAVAEVADAIVIGSRIIEAIESAPAGDEVEVVEQFVSGIRSALDVSARSRKKERA